MLLMKKQEFKILDVKIESKLKKYQKFMQMDFKQLEEHHLELK